MESVRGLYGFDRIYACVYIYIRTHAHMHICWLLYGFGAGGAKASGLSWQVLYGFTGSRQLIGRFRVLVQFICWG